MFKKIMILFVSVLMLCTLMGCSDGGRSSKSKRSTLREFKKLCDKEYEDEFDYYDSSISSNGYLSIDVGDRKLSRDIEDILDGDSSSLDWDKKKKEMLSMYDDILDLAEEEDIDDPEVILNLVSDDGEDVFLTIEDGDITYDVLEDVNMSSSTAGSSPDGEKALEEAKNFIKYGAYSYEGLIDILLYKGYTAEAAELAADNCEADWKEEALQSAEQYLSSLGISYDGLIDMLEYEKFNQEEIDYAMSRITVDWKEEALQEAQEYVTYLSISYDRIMELLEFEGFSKEEIDYAMNNLEADWNEEALGCLEEYVSNNASASKDDVVDYLEMEKFTSDQIDYALKQAGY